MNVDCEDHENLQEAHTGGAMSERCVARMRAASQKVTPNVIVVTLSNTPKS